MTVTSPSLTSLKLTTWCPNSAKKAHRQPQLNQMRPLCRESRDTPPRHVSTFSKRKPRVRPQLTLPSLLTNALATCSYPYKLAFIPPMPTTYGPDKLSPIPILNPLRGEHLFVPGLGSAISWIHRHGHGSECHSMQWAPVLFDLTPDHFITVRSRKNGLDGSTTPRSLS